MRRFAVLLVSTTMSVALLSSSAAPAKAVINGEPDLGRHPYVVMVATSGFPDYPGVYGWATGTLISPTVVLTAAHLFEWPTPDGTALETATSVLVWLDEGPTFPGFPTGPGDAISASAVIPNPDFCPIGWAPSLPCAAQYGHLGQLMPDAHDLGLVILSTPVTGVGTLPSLPPAGLVDALPAQSSLTVVGYGLQSEPNRGQFKEKGECNADNDYCATTERTDGIVRLIPGQPRRLGEFMAVTGDPGQGDSRLGDGDSGAPFLYTDPATGTVYVAGVMSFLCHAGVGSPCYPTRLDTSWALSWLSGYLTP